MPTRHVLRAVNQVYSLLGRGLKWSYRKYGLKGAVGFVGIVAVVYYFASDRLDRLLEEDTAAEVA